jgi:hypothetical protein
MAVVLFVLLGRTHILYSLLYTFLKLRLQADAPSFARRPYPKQQLFHSIYRFHLIHIIYIHFIIRKQQQQPINCT